MATNVFGDPIDNKNQTPIQSAQQAYNEPGGRQARRFVQNWKRQYGNGVSTPCLLYNATGNTITLSYTHDWHGKIYTPPPYPRIIQNGQWGAFLHRGTDGNGSVAAVVYRGMDGNGNHCDYLMSWMHPSGNKSNSVCTEINEPDYFKGNWTKIYSNLEQKGTQDSSSWNEFWATIRTDTEKFAMVEATFTLKDATGGATSIPRVDPGVALVGYDVNAADCEGDATTRATSEGDDAAPAT